MKLGRVIGRVVATVRTHGLEGRIFLVVQPLDGRLEPEGASLVMCDVAQSGQGDVVFWVGGREAALALEPFFVPVDATVVGNVEDGSSSLESDRCTSPA